MTELKGSEPEVVVGVAWYRRKQWQRVRDISTDVDDLENPYEEWLRLAERKLAELTVAGLRVEKDAYRSTACPQRATLIHIGRWRR